MSVYSVIVIVTVSLKESSLIELSAGQNLEPFQCAEIHLVPDFSIRCLQLHCESFFFVSSSYTEWK